MIVMLANLTEGGKKKCDKYWPDLEETREFGSISVTYLKNDIYADYEYRTFQISYESSYRIVSRNVQPVSCKTKRFSLPRWSSSISRHGLTMESPFIPSY